MSNEDFKYIVIEDISKDLTPIGIGFRSPILRPSKFPLETIGKLLTISNVSKMYAVHPTDRTVRVSLNTANYKKPFEVIWKEQNPGKEYPLERDIVEVPNTPPKAEETTGGDDGNNEQSPPQVQNEGADTPPSQPEVPDVPIDTNVVGPSLGDNSPQEESIAESGDNKEDSQGKKESKVNEDDQKEKTSKPKRSSKKSSGKAVGGIKR